MASCCLSPNKSNEKYDTVKACFYYGLSVVHYLKLLNWNDWSAWLLCTQNNLQQAV